MERALGNIFVRDMRFDKKGDVVAGHKHNFDHVTYCVLGSILVERKFPNGRDAAKELAAGDYLLIEAGVEHRISCLSDGALAHCIYAHREPHGEIVQQYTGWGTSYS